MTEKQIEIANEALQFILKHEGQVGTSTLTKHLYGVYGRNIIVASVKNSLTDNYKLTELWGEAYIRLTPEGHQAAKIGVEKWLKQKVKEQQLETKVKETTIASNYFNMFNIVWGVFCFILGALTKDQLIKLWEWLRDVF